ncbi:L-aspartate oxidase [Mangrovicoccus algicola]|uniref:L-aspartate oxidase n=1 Tax=Mangrovicoccus algicola TaxID=2771008 RepID=A0A8J7CH90_9RHOB|nr:L-aspartate oxidase [Mangrovicoccus algicola]MBE3637965.1 L-aspartate oxidase [Mangrovicoccus algicola]
MRRLATGRVVILGAGIGGLSAALALAPRPVLVVSPQVLGEGASSAWAQGGIAAAMGPSDSAADHARDTVGAGAGLVDAAVAAAVAGEAPQRIRDLTLLGAPFDRDPAGGYVLSREAAHSRPRVVRIGGDRAGAGIMRALIAAIRATPSVQVLEGVAACGLHLRHGRVAGAELMRIGADGAAASRPVCVTAPAILLAGGGAGGLFAVTTNPPGIAGQAVGLAARAGALIADAEFVQFHPTALDLGRDPAPLATEALRGAGAVLRDASGAPIMAGLHPDADLAPRDVVARAVFAAARAGRRPVLDATQAPGAAILQEFPEVSRACLAAGIDPARQPMPVAAAAHYHIGGVQSDARGRSSLPGLWVCGEAACTGLHGANRLASNGLLEALVFARRAAADMATCLPSAAPSPEVVLPPLRPLPPPDAALVLRLRQAMTAGAGVIRDAAGLSRCLAEIAEIEAAARACPVLVNMTATATLIAAAALLRRESRGAHFRSDFPRPAGGAGCRSRLTLQAALEIRAAARHSSAMVAVTQR